ncbi:glycoside hydrolase family 3 N-terminal domain-containing protein [Amphiplicatus metriothermophilus]|uniref:beta-glucosidase n=1 Tax=Amphiplicatus metriothermophilus TaxID=1519374 RepID=A0A239PY47_9PROT|nr:glycoside hydrolase family 3 N-terminal domain-containing protein [Amphiplicatus metriothermophilus]MBB5518981.1 beta-glucosidase [Amphiplicatus metriothermophilus]SNT74587.1 beta-glucosidase [Amphiplicatus metriothermophilus]
MKFFTPARAPLAAAALTFATVASAAAQEEKTPLYKNPEAPVEARVDDLLARMTLEEKIAQITTVWTRKTELFDETGAFDPEKAKVLYPAGIGHFARPNDLQGPSSPLEKPFRDARETVALVNAVQRYAVEETRLGIPVLFHEEGLHGYAARGATSFPQAIALASTWDPELIEKVYSIAAREIRARGAHLVLSPVVDVARDPRWGRIEETYGEDPYLVSELGVAAIKGFQGDALPLAEDKVFATLKHMTGHGQPESGTNVGPANLSERLLREIFFPPFEQAVKRTNILSVMASYNEIDGVPSHANGWLLNDVLRGEWGFKGGVVSDYWGIDDLQRLHFVEPDLESAAVRALKSGVDFDLPDGQAFALLPDALKKGRVSQAEIDRAVRRMLKIKFLAGLFENPYADADYAEAITDNEEARALAEEAARKAIVLLKNDGVLPLAKESLRRLAVIGPNADAVRLGGYSDVPTRVITILDGIRAHIGEEVEILHHEGVKIVERGDWWSDEVVLADREENLKRIREAKKVAKKADAVVLVIGGTEATSREGWSADHLGDRSDIELVGEQKELAEAMFSLGKPVVVVLINGKPLGVEDVAARANALVEGWYLGQEGGTAMAQVLFGDYNPGGKLPVTIPRHAGQLPLVYNRKPSALRGYLFDTTEPLYPFGYGLSYTTFEISAPRLTAPEIDADGETEVVVSVANTGERAGDEVVQLYIRDRVSSVTRPVKELRGFRRVTLQPGERKEVRFVIGPEHLRFWNKDMKRVVEPGEFEIMVGPNSQDLKTAVLTVRG